MSSQTFRAVISRHHVFPGEYIFRVIGANFTDLPDVRTVLERHLADEGVIRFRMDCQKSSRGSYTAFRIYAQVDNVEQVVSLTDKFKKVAGVHIVL